MFGSGASRAICGSIAVARPDLLRQWLTEFGPERIVLGADTRDGRVAVNGWQEASAIGVEELIGRFADSGLRQVICTDIAKDGMLSGIRQPPGNAPSRSSVVKAGIWPACTACRCFVFVSVSHIFSTGCGAGDVMSHTMPAISAGAPSSSSRFDCSMLVT